MRNCKMKAAASLFSMVFTISANSTCRGDWSKDGFEPYSSQSKKSTSPDGKIVLTATDAGLRLSRAGVDTLLSTEINPPLTEAVWSSDSRYLAINVSDGGEIGTWSVDLISTETGKSVASVLQAASVDAKRRTKCVAPEAPNMMLVGWSKDTDRALILAEVPPHSSCSDMGAKIGYDVDVVTGKIIATFSEGTLRSRWSNVMGCWLERH